MHSKKQGNMELKLVCAKKQFVQRQLWPCSTIEVQ